MHESLGDLVRVLSQHVPRAEAARAAIQTARMFWSRAQRLQESADRFAERIRPRGDRDLLEQLGEDRGRIQTLQERVSIQLASDGQPVADLDPRGVRALRIERRPGRELLGIDLDDSTSAGTLWF